MKEKRKQIIYFTLLILALCLMAAAAWLGEKIPEPLGRTLFALGGILMGLGAVKLALSWSQRRMTPEERRDAERGETDERNVAIREKAAYSSWFWTLYLLWAAFMVTEIFAGGLWGAAASAVIVLHCVFYMINIGRWAKKM